MIAQVHSLPPIRTQLQDPTFTGPDGLPQTAKEWYYFWRDSEDKINTLTELVTYGTSAARPDPIGAPDGALYVEQDRGGIIYQAQGGEWHYLAGTMWGTLNPDQRPVGLGPNDAGFQFRSTDTDPNYAPRQFLWSGAEWIETTMVLYGTHLARPAADEKTPPRTIYVETDRGGVIYQQQANAWHYLAGTMYGLLAAAPNDLGANDARFQFRATDTGANSGRLLIWSGSIWVETTPNRSGTHATRLALPLANAWNGMLWVETDRSVVYQNQGGAWAYVTGTMYGATIAARPTDLGAGDAGFLFFANDTLQLWRWNGSAWDNRTPANDVQIAYGTANLALSTTYTVVPGLSFALNRAGRYLITGNLSFFFVGDPAGTGLRGQLSFNGAAQANGIVVALTANNTFVYGTLQWTVAAASAGLNVSLLAAKDSGTGTSQINGGNSSLSAVWIGP